MHFQGNTVHGVSISRAVTFLKLKENQMIVFTYEKFYGILHIDLIIRFLFLSFTCPIVSIGQRCVEVKRVNFRG